MTVTAEKPERVTIRVSLDLTPEMKEVIEDLAQRAGTSQADLLRRAIALFKTIKDAEREGQRPFLLGEDGSVTRLVGI